ncbi:MAG: hypothetical protein NDJ92_06005 [Thermoanaerobaculia bacterium]|nr:hypothetical protein [Thermoanaerobaculia bacterium]
MEHVKDCSEVVLLCRDCGMRFEGGVADRSRSGRERCPQCGLEDVAPAERPDDSAFVVRRGTKFR